MFVHYKQCCDQGWFFPDPNFFHPGSASKNFKDVSKLLEILSRLFIPDPDPDLLPIPDPGSRGLKGARSWIPDLDPQHWLEAFVALRPTLQIKNLGFLQKFINRVFLSWKRTSASTRSGNEFENTTETFVKKRNWILRQLLNGLRLTFDSSCSSYWVVSFFPLLASGSSAVLCQAASFPLLFRSTSIFHNLTRN